MKKTTSWDLKDLSSSDPKIKYGCAKALVATARENPRRLYPHIEFFIDLLDSENQILKWTAIDIVGCLIKADKEKKAGRLLGRLCGFLNAGKLITAGHAVSALAEIAQVKCEYRGRITRKLLKVEHYDYDTVECRNIALGKVILALETFYDDLGMKEKQAAREFVKRQTTNSRHATGKKAEEFLKKINKKTHS
ncbi:MAG TPA: hypothetical protein VF399_08180 [bacterium]